MESWQIKENFYKKYIDPSNRILDKVEDELGYITVCLGVLVGATLLSPAWAILGIWSMVHKLNINIRFIFQYKKYYNKYSTDWKCRHEK